MTVSGPDMFLAICFLLVTIQVFAFSAYLLEQVRKIRSEIRLVRGTIDQLTVDDLDGDNE